MSCIFYCRTLSSNQKVKLKKVRVLYTYVQVKLLLQSCVEDLLYILGKEQDFQDLDQLLRMERLKEKEKKKDDSKSAEGEAEDTQVLEL